jgi:hypothetical protein
MTSSPRTAACCSLSVLLNICLNVNSLVSKHFRPYILDSTIFAYYLYLCSNICCVPCILLLVDFIVLYLFFWVCVVCYLSTLKELLCSILVFSPDGLFYDAFSVTRLYTVYDRVISVWWWWWWTEKDKHPCLKRDSNPRSQRLSNQAYASDHAATRTGPLYTNEQWTGTNMRRGGTGQRFQLCFRTHY